MRTDLRDQADARAFEDERLETHVQELAFLLESRDRVLAGAAAWASAGPLESRILRHLDALDANLAEAKQSCDDERVLRALESGDPPWCSPVDRTPLDVLRERLVQGDESAIRSCRELAATDPRAWILFAQSSGPKGLDALSSAARESSQEAPLAMAMLGNLRALPMLRSLGVEAAVLRMLVGGRTSLDELSRGKRHRNGRPVTPADLLAALKGQDSSSWERRAAADELTIRYRLPWVNVSASVTEQQQAIAKVARALSSSQSMPAAGRWYFNGRLIS